MCVCVFTLLQQHSPGCARARWYRRHWQPYKPAKQETNGWCSYLKQPGSQSSIRGKHRSCHQNIMNAANYCSTYHEVQILDSRSSTSYYRNTWRSGEDSTERWFTFHPKGLNRAKQANTHLLLGVRTPLSLGKCDPESSPDGHPRQVVSLDLRIVDDLTAIHETICPATAIQARSDCLSLDSSNYHQPNQIWRSLSVEMRTGAHNSPVDCSIGLIGPTYDK